MSDLVSVVSVGKGRLEQPKGAGVTGDQLMSTGRAYETQLWGLGPWDHPMGPGAET